MSESAKKPLPGLSEARPEALSVLNPPWEDVDVQSLRDYLSHNPRFLAYLAARAPKIETASLERSALSGAEHNGFEEIFMQIASMASTANVSEKSPFIGNESED